MERDELLGLRDDVARATTIVAPSWPLSSTIAVNPLSGFEDRPFEAALGAGQALFGARGNLALTEFRDEFHSGRVGRDDLVSALARRIPDLSESEVEVLVLDLVYGNDEAAPERSEITLAERFDRDHGTDFRPRLDLAISDWCAEWSVRAEPGDLWTSWWTEEREVAGEFPADPAAALLAGLTRLGVPGSAHRDYLERHLAALAGWAAHLRWRQERFGGDIMVGHLARCVTLEAQLLDGVASYGPDADPASSQPTAAERAETVARRLGEQADRAHITATLARLPGPARSMVWLDAYEWAIRGPLLQSLARTPPPDTGRDEPDRPADAQVVCCIDVRSEGLRRHLEAVGDYETFGYAGFFGLAARIEPLTGGAATEQYPVLLQAATELREVAVNEHRRDAERAVEQERVAAGLDDAWRAAKYHPIAPLALAEGAGWLAGPIAALRTCLPRLSAWVADRLPEERPSTAPTTYDRSNLDVETQAATVAAIVGLGLGPRMAPLVVLCGHHARVDNNPLESGLACGACGGNGGAPNARAVAEMANDPAVRAALAARGTAIRDDTWFVAAQHDTTTDRVTLLDTDRVPATHSGLIDRLRGDLGRAGDGAALERTFTLPDNRSRESLESRPPHRLVDRTRGRGRDWAEPVAELGLAGNMAFVVGPRSMTQALDLGRRVFLHSYEAADDTDGSVLAGILTAPLVVAQWINAQYYFSTTDPEHFGSGTKAVHNILGDVGVLSGPGGDLRRGLPLQSVRAGSRLLHEPVRLLAVVQGRLDHIDATINGSTTLAQLVGNEWISLVARADPQAPWQRWTASGWVTHTTGSPVGRAPAGASR
jgi:hypothetical protein